MACSNVGTTSHKQLVDDINENVLLCAVCQERFTSPKILPCVHTFCEKCLKTWVEKNGGQLTCPTCRKSHIIPPGGIGALNNNLFINDVLEMFSNVKIGQDMLKCEVCASAASFWCKDCVQFFCQECSVPHNVMRVTKNHKVITVEEYQELEKSAQRHLIRPQFCPNHPDNQLVLFCDVCQVTACIQCGLINHNGSDHRMISMEDALKKYTPNLHHLIDELNKSVTSLKSGEEKQNQAMKLFKREQVSEEKQIKQHAADIINRVKQEEQKLLTKVTEVCGKRDKELQAQLDHIELDLERAKSMQSYAVNCLYHGNPADILSQKRNLEDGLTELGNKASLGQHEIGNDFKLKFKKTMPSLLTIGEITCERRESSEGTVEDSLPSANANTLEGVPVCNREVQLSKKLSNILRHNANKFGFQLDKGGFLNVEDMLHHQHFRGYTIEDVKRVVTNNDKQRFALRNHPDSNLLQIRANQGHSVKVQGLELKRITDASEYPTVIYGTYSKHLERIKEKGLSRMGRNHIHFAPGMPDEVGVISGMRWDCDVIIVLDLEKAIKDGIEFMISANNVILSSGDEHGYISVDYFKEIRQRRT
ncbi:E3 ubiquitin-protein ligase TRIM56-like [Saccoglossus kowalevskii]|uniref:2'-phosphotransferase n=1 Tax=Saccoglossus kowalevskii TaxID=10224 RepID=A0ABM0MCZ2_SACKO|nr:PREDICTED: tripartite motif-containing protein 2-like [Saccoglossus kowalevskii]